MAKDPNFDMMNGNDYSPSSRANSAVRTANGGKSGAPDKPDDGSVSAPSDADQPSNQHTGGSPASNTATNAESFEQPSGGRGKVEKG